MADTRQCNGNCMTCTIFQRQYCASQIAFNNMGLLGKLMENVAELKEKVEAIQNNEASLINPIEQEMQSDSAECGVAHEKTPKTINTKEEDEL